MKLHLGCGHNYIEGWVNIEGPRDELCYNDIKADIHARIEDLDYPDNSVDEILMNAVFEHFPRHIAIMQLRKFYNWLKEGGKITIVVPDFFATVNKLKKSKSPEEQQFWWRHIFGPQDTITFGTHYDGFDEKKLKYIFSIVGFAKFICIKEGKWPNLRFTAIKKKPFLSENDACQNIINYMALYEAREEAGVAFAEWMKAMGLNIEQKPLTLKFKTQNQSLLNKIKCKIVRKVKNV
ncbi:MAG: methyltransferase domain-containing protein [Planctomycetia bacterium]|uniref:class I SAM-dependent methyltransferase n=1 Tax=Candidatus Kuenenia sp. TaxID=2499824 RepID=UPI001D4A8ABD|nr:methyltransferase domain-containing protein [Planctomycetia bacterium]